MDVYLLPVMPAPPGGEPAFELYCEPPPDPEPEPSEVSNRGFFARMVARFKQALAEGEAEERRQEDGEPDEPPKDFGGRVGRFVKRKLAAAVAEQRVLWHLRHVSAARLHHPVTITSQRAIEVATTEFTKDLSKHRLWAIIDGVIFIATGAVAIVPGPNLLAYYFIFRCVGHFFSYRGARKGMDPALWTGVPSEPLEDLQQALTLEPGRRAQKIETVARALDLERLSAFMRRVDNRPRKSNNSR